MKCTTRKNQKREQEVKETLFISPQLNGYLDFAVQLSNDFLIRSLPPSL